MEAPKSSIGQEHVWGYENDPCRYRESSCCSREIWLSKAVSRVLGVSHKSGLIAQLAWLERGPHLPLYPST